MTYIFPHVTVYAGSTIALYTATGTQAYTNYTKPVSAVYVKENGAWKLDLIGTIKYDRDQYRSQNPTDAFVTGSGTTNLTMVDMDYYSQPRVNDGNNRLLIWVKNNGQTTIQKFLVYISLNGSDVYQDVVTDKLLPGQELLLAFPIDTYWTFPSVVKTPGSYRTEASVVLLPENLEQNVSDNGFYFDSQFTQ
jgi:hypothetical protein